MPSPALQISRPNPPERYTRGGSPSDGGEVSHASPDRVTPAQMPPEQEENSAQENPGRRDAAQVAEDHDLVRRAREGDEDAFSALVQKYQARVWRIARQRVPSDEDAQDLAQEAFLRVFRNLDRFDFQYPFTTWLFRIVTNLTIDHLRKRRTAQSIHAAEEDEASPELEDHRDERPSDRIEADETADEIRAVLDTLAPHFQSVLVLRELEGLACNEIAEIVGATHVTVRWRLHRGRKLFQEAWERRGRRGDRPQDGSGEGAQDTGGAAETS